MTNQRVRRGRSEGVHQRVLEKEGEIIGRRNLGYLRLTENTWFVLNFRAAALAAIQPGARGVVMVPVKAHLGTDRNFYDHYS